MTKFILITTALLFTAVASDAQKKKPESVYTDLASEKCRTIESNADEAGSYVGECAGVGGYRLEVVEGDLRQTINVVAPNRRKHQLELWNKVSSGFSAVGAKAEWRVRRAGKSIVPSALIFRFNASDNLENAAQNTSYLVVVKITKTEICVTNVLKPSANVNAQARNLADASANKACYVRD